MNFLIGILFYVAFSATLFLSFVLFMIGVVVGANLTGNYENLTTKVIAATLAFLPWVLWAILIFRFLL